MIKVYYPSPVGVIKIKFNERGLISLSFTDRKEVDYKNKYCRQSNRGKLRLIYKLIYNQLNEYFTGRRKIFDLPVIMTGTPFQIRVWEYLKRIPYGETRSYSRIAREIGIKGGARAVGNASSDNPHTIIIPCHRVIGKDGSICGYAGGMWRKKWLLEHENKYKKGERKMQFAHRIT